MASKYYVAQVADTAFGTSANWVGSGAPTTGDSATFDGRMINLLTGSDQSAITLAALYQYASAPQIVGTSALPLKIGATLCQLGIPPNDGSSPTPAQISLDFASIQTTVTVFSSANAGTNSLPPILLKGSSGSNKCTVISGIVGWGCDIPGSTYTLPTADIVGRNAYLILESGGTLATINQDDGKALIKAAATTINQNGGTLTTMLTGAITTLNVGGTSLINSTGTITNLNVVEGGVVDFGGSFDAITVTNCNVYGNGKVLDPNKRVTFTNGVIFNRGATSNQCVINGPVTAAYT